MLHRFSFLALQAGTRTHSAPLTLSPAAPKAQGDAPSSIWVLHLPARSARNKKFRKICNRIIIIISNAVCECASVCVRSIPGPFPRSILLRVTYNQFTCFFKVSLKNVRTCHDALVWSGLAWSWSQHVAGFGVLLSTFFVSYRFDSFPKKSIQPPQPTMHFIRALVHVKRYRQRNVLGLGQAFGPGCSIQRSVGRWVPLCFGLCFFGFK